MAERLQSDQLIEAFNQSGASPPAVPCMASPATQTSQRAPGYSSRTHETHPARLGGVTSEHGRDLSPIPAPSQATPRSPAEWFTPGEAATHLRAHPPTLHDSVPARMKDLPELSGLAEARARLEVYYKRTTAAETALPREPGSFLLVYPEHLESAEFRVLEAQDAVSGP